MTKRARQVYSDDYDAPKPLYAVWELTLACDQACRHCGSRAGKARPNELRGEAALDVADQLVEAGAREVTLIGGEAYLHPDVYAIAARLNAGGVRVTLQTGARQTTPEMIARLKEAGVVAIGVSIDGLEAVHEELRAVPGGFQRCLDTLRDVAAAGLIGSANTQINRLNMGALPELAQVLRDHGARAWQVQLTVPMGRAADRPEWIIQPWMMLEIVSTLGEIQAKASREEAEGAPRFDVFAGNNIGYYGPHEVLLRSRPGGRPVHWTGCKAGQMVLGIEADGALKACPSLPTAPYLAGNLKDTRLGEAWAKNEKMAFTRERGVEDLWGHCATCYYAEVCKGGCSFTAHCTLGRRGNNPFCYYRAEQLKKRGLRERLVHVKRAAGQPFDFGRFELIEEPWPSAPI